MLRTDRRYANCAKVRIPETGVNRLVQEDATSAVPKAETGPWMAKGPELKACWNKPPSSNFLQFTSAGQYTIQNF